MLRVDRLKQCSKVKNFYKYAFKIEEPYRMLLDPHFVEHAAQVNIPIRQFVETNLEAKVEFNITSCCKSMLEKRNDKVQRACHGRSVLDWLPKPCRVIRCDHSQEIIYKQRRSGATVDVVQHNAVHEDVSSSSCQSPNSSTVSRSNDIGTGHKYKSEELRLFSHKCIMSYTVKSNRRKFWYCAHDPLLVPRLLRKRGAPVILMEHNIFRICEPSNRSKERHEYLEAAKSDVPDWEKSAMNVGKVVETVGARKVKKRRRADAPDTKSEELTSLEPSKKRSRSKSRRVKKPTD